jgi:hypothetical protein
VKRRLAHDEKLISLLIHGLNKELANLADLSAASVAARGAFYKINPKMKQIEGYNSAVESMAYLEGHHHLVHSCSREGILELLSAARHRWLLGFDRGGADAGRNGVAEGGYSRIPGPMRLKRAGELASACHELDLVITVFETLDV